MRTRPRMLPRGWYPGSAEECFREMNEFLKGFTPPEGSWAGGIAPHAGWYYSGRAAAKVFSALASGNPPDRIVVYGGHLQGSSNPIAYVEDYWETPLGALALDVAFVEDLVSEGAAQAAYRDFSDNTVEIQLPFVKHFFPDVPLIAVHAPASARAVRLGEVIEEMLRARGLTAAYLGSADLTHYGPNYGFVPHSTGAAAVKWVKEENDRSLIEKALAMDAPGLIRDARERQNTCSAGPIAAVIASMSKRGVLAGKLIDYYTSFDVSPGSSFVGYAAIVY